MTYAIVGSSFVLGLFLNSRFEEFSGVFRAFLFVYSITLFERLVNLDESRTFLVEYHHNEKQVDIVIVILIYFFVVDTNIRAS